MIPRTFRPLVVSCVLLCNLTLAAKAPHNAASSSIVDRDYVAALAAADRFMNAWATRDHETGVIMLTDAAKHGTSEDRLQAFFSPADTQQAYAVGSGRKAKPGVYSFPVVLYESPTSARSKWVHPRFSHIIVMRTSKEDWAVDKLP